MSTLCVCGHAEGYHDAHLIEKPSVSGLCSIWACGCDRYEAMDQT